MFVPFACFSSIFTAPKIPILICHDLEPTEFKRHLHYLMRSGYRTIRPVVEILPRTGGVDETLPDLALFKPTLNGFRDKLSAAVDARTARSTYSRINPRRTYGQKRHLTRSHSSWLGYASRIYNNKPGQLPTRTVIETLVYAQNGGGLCHPLTSIFPCTATIVGIHSP